MSKSGACAPFSKGCAIANGFRKVGKKILPAKSLGSSALAADLLEYVKEVVGLKGHPDASIQVTPVSPDDPAYQWLVLLKRRAS